MMPEIGGLPRDSAWDKQFRKRGERRLAECVVGRGLGGVWILRGNFSMWNINQYDNLLTYPLRKLTCPKKGTISKDNLSSSP